MTVVTVTPPPGAQAALRAVRLLKLFTPKRAELQLNDVATLAGLNKTTAHRLLRALQSEGLIDRNHETGGYCLGPALMALGVQALSSNTLRLRARPFLKRLAAESGETATLEIPIDDSMLILDEVTGDHVVGATPNVGTRWPIHATSTGKALIAFEENGLNRLQLDLKPLTKNTIVQRLILEKQIGKIRRTGIAETVDELENGFSGVATIVRGSLGEVLGAMSICGPSHRLDEARRMSLAAALLSAAEQLGPRH
ncbi:MAG: IclR family transcriptional regulator [Woeseiaceae bacterium]|nr:IclR family transcriptional regulator [Woeseiaceae bacterium]